MLVRRKQSSFRCAWFLGMLGFIGCGGPDNAVGGQFTDSEYFGEDCTAQGIPSIYISAGESEGFAALEDGQPFGFRATVEAGSDLELSVRLVGIEPQTFDLTIQVVDEDVLLGQGQFTGVDSYCLIDGDYLIPSLVISFGSLGLIDLEGRLVSIEAEYVVDLNSDEGLSDQVDVELISEES